MVISHQVTILSKEEERIQLLGAAIWNCVPSF